MAEERIYTINLRSEIHKVPIYRRAEKAVTATRQFLQRHMKSDEVKIGKYLNEYLHSQGRKNPPHKVQIKVWKEKIKIKEKEFEIVKADLINAPQEKSLEPSAVKEQPELKVEDKKLEEHIEKEAEEKKEVLTHPVSERKESKKPITPEEKIAVKERGKERTKQAHSKAQKPIHEKKK